jgi:hypothetical protein
VTAQQKQWFEVLTKDRADSAATLKKRSMRGIQHSVVDKYSAPAHFIYELLQNADDATATRACFKLKADGLLFIHNGSTRFTISNPETEDADSDNGTLGHVNSITSIANSNKTEVSIGKFGVGFKAVFQYTETPHIYDPNFWFKIERFIVPLTLETDFAGRKSDETIFWFPFDYAQKPPADCWDEINEKLKALVFPTLFLSQLESVSYEIDGRGGEYVQKVKRKIVQDGLCASLISFVSVLDGKTEKQGLWLFSRAEKNGHTYSVGYALKNGQLRPMNFPAFCFFPTKETTNLNFIIHAPFLLTDSRESIKAGEEHNQKMVQRLAELAADSLLVLREERLIDDGILDIIPYDEELFSELTERQKISFLPFYTALKEKLQAEELLPAEAGKCVGKDDAYWFQDQPIVTLFSNRQLTKLVENKNAHWVFTSVARNKTENEKRGQGYFAVYPKRSYIDDCVSNWFEMEEILSKMDAAFIEAQPIKWLHELYEYLHNNPSRAEIVRNAPIFLNHEGNAVPAFDEKNELVLFLPDDSLSGYTTVKRELLTNKKTRAFIENFGVKKPSLRDEIYNKILPAYDTDEKTDTASHFMTFFRYFKECPNEEVQSFIDLIKNKVFLLGSTAANKKILRCKPAELYLPTDVLRQWFETKPDTNFLLLNKYRAMVEKSELALLDEFLGELGILRKPNICSRKLDLQEAKELKAPHGRGRGNGDEDEWKDTYIDGCKEIIDSVTAEKSLLLWRVLSEMELEEQHLYGIYIFNNRGQKRNAFYSSETHRLRNSKWILNKAGELVSSDAVTIQTLSTQYDITNPGALSLIKFLEIHDETQETAHLSEEELRKIKLAEEIEQSGLSEEEIRSALEAAKRRKNALIDGNQGGVSERPQDNTRTDKEGDSGQEGNFNHSTPVMGSSGAEATEPMSNVLRDIEKRMANIKAKTTIPTPVGVPSKNNPSVSFDITKELEKAEDTDEYIPCALDYSQKIDLAKDRFAEELEQLKRNQELMEKATSLPKYSYGWFLSLLELECAASAEKNADGKQISIHFTKVEHDAQKPRTIILKQPNRFIPQSIEELSGVRVDLQYSDGSKGKLHIEVRVGGKTFLYRVNTRCRPS